MNYISANKSEINKQLQKISEKIRKAEDKGQYVDSDIVSTAQTYIH